MELLFKQLKQRSPCATSMEKMCLKEFYRTAILSYLYGAVSELSDKVGNLYNDPGRKLRNKI